MRLFDSQGRPVELGEEIGAGGEGTVYEVRGNAHLVAKTYKSQPSPEKAAKLSAMVAARANGIATMAAWPSDTLCLRPNGPVSGILMPRVRDHEEIHNLYSPAHRKLKYADKDWVFLVHTAMNCATAFEALHSLGCVIGDVNQGNVLVSKQGTVFLIDCDSFQFSANGRVMPCEVGVVHFTPPELQGKSFRTVTRTPNHDNFGLAVLVFHLLFMGRHPFAGRFLGSGEMPVERAVSEFRFAYGRSAAALQMERPPWTLAVGDLAPTVQNLFERAFVRGSEAGGRPTAHEWREQLSALKGRLSSCPNDRGHRFESALSQCPWCRLVQAGAPNFFASITIAATATGTFQFTLDVGPLWNAIANVPRPSTLFGRMPYAIPRPITPTPLPPLEPAPGMRKYVGWVASTATGLALATALILPFVAYLATTVAVVFLIWWLGMYVMSPIWSEARRRNAAVRRNRAELAKVQAQWTSSAKEFDQEFQQELAQLTQAREQVRQLRGDYQAELQNLERDSYQRQKNQYLQSFFISDHKIEKIGEGRKATLESAGIETAFDVTDARVSRIPGFGPTLTASLLAWRRNVEARFQFNPNLGIPTVERQTLNFKFAQRQLQLETLLRNGEHRLKAVHHRARDRMLALTAEIIERELLVVQAEADAKLAIDSKWN